MAATIEIAVSTGVGLWVVCFNADGSHTIAPDSMPADFGGETGWGVETGWLWAHFALSDQRSRAFLQQAKGLPAEARSLLLGEDCSPRIGFDGAWAYGVLPDYGRAFDGGIEGMGRVRFAFDDTRMITTRRHPMYAVHDVRRRAETGGIVLSSPLEAFLAINRRYCEVTEDQVDELSADLDGIEDHVLAGGDLGDVKLGPLRRDLSRRHREIAGLRTAYHRAGVRHGGQAHPLTARLPQLQQQTEDADHEVAALQDRARLVHEELDTRLTGEANRTLHALTVMSALLMPPTLIVGAFGMNLKGITFGEDRQGFAIVCGLCVAAVVGIWLLLKRMRRLR